MAPMEQIGPYRVQRRVGAGAFATVWLATHPKTGQSVAVKVLADNWSEDPDTRGRFLNEARIMRRIRSPRLVQVHDIGSMGSQPYFVMDYCDAGSLQDVRHSSMHPGAKLRLCAEACRAVAVLHEHDIIHRDVTPGNLLLHDRGDGTFQVRLADLGVAKELKQRATQTMAAGTPAYMAPEQARADHLMGPTSDVYSLTGMTYAVLSTRPPFPRQTMVQLVQRPDHVKPAPIAESIGAPPDLDALLNSGLSTDPANRPGSAPDLADALDAMATRLGTPAGPVPLSARTSRPHLSEITPIAPLRVQNLPEIGSTRPPQPPQPARWAADPHGRATMRATPPGSGQPASTLPSEASRAVAMPQAPVPAYLPEHSVASAPRLPRGWELGPSAPPEPDPFPTWLIALWVGLGVLIVTAVILAVYIWIIQ